MTSISTIMNNSSILGSILPRDNEASTLSKYSSLMVYLRIFFAAIIVFSIIILILEITRKKDKTKIPAIVLTILITLLGIVGMIYTTVV